MINKKLWEHQQDYVDDILTNPAWLVDGDMGVGKSLVIVSVVDTLELQRTLIVCPKSVVDVWPKEFAKHLDDSSIRVLSLRVGAVARRSDTLATALAVDLPLVAVINYDSVWREPMASIIKKTQWDMVVCDESHRIKSPSSKCSIFMRTLGRGVPKRVCMSGTPLAHSPLDAYAQYRFLDPTVFGTSFVRFRNEFAMMGGYENKQVIGFKNLEEFNRRYFSIARRVRKDDVLDLPEQVHENRYTELSKSARRAYDELKDDLITQVDAGIVTAANAMSKLIRLAQVTSGFVHTEDGEIGEVDDGKERLLEDILIDLPRNEPVVVFARFHHDLDRIARSAHSNHRHCYELSGRANMLSEWQDSDRGDVLAVQIQSGGVGIDLTRACYCVYYTKSFSLADYEQSKARLHRPGQLRSVTYFHLMAQNTIDTYIYAALKKRKDVITYALEGVCGHGAEDSRGQTDQ